MSITCPPTLGSTGNLTFVGLCADIVIPDRVGSSNASHHTAGGGHGRFGSEMHWDHIFNLSKVLRSSGEECNLAVPYSFP